MKIYFIILLQIVLVGFAMATEEPKYKLIEKSNEFELREYDSIIIAQTKVSGSLDEASSKGFRIIADYIFGNNVSSNTNNEKISMTKPVTIVEKPEKIAMTAPVTMEQKDSKWLIHFVMPSKYSLNTLPTPNNQNVNLIEIPKKRYAVIVFSGLVGEEKFAKKTQKLFEWMNKKEIVAKGEPNLARYNPPWTLPFFRRNEVMIEY